MLQGLDAAAYVIVLLSWIAMHCIALQIVDTERRRALPQSSAQFSPNGVYVVATGCDNAARIWQADTGRSIATLEGHDGRVYCATFSGDGQKVVTASRDETARTWDASSGECLVTLDEHSAPVVLAAVSPDGNTVATCSGDAVHLLDSQTGRRLHTLTVHRNSGFDDAYAVSFHPDGAQVITTSCDGTVRMWNTVSGQQLHLFNRIGRAFWGSAFGHRDAASYGMFSPDGNSVLVTYGDGSAEIRNAISGEVSAEVDAPEKDWITYRVSIPAFNSESTMAATAFEGTTRVWKVQDGKVVCTLPGHTDFVRFVAFSRNGAKIITTSDDKTARLWDSKTGRLLHTLSGHTGSVWWADFSPDNSLVVTASADTTSRVWDVGSGKQVHVLER